MRFERLIQRRIRRDSSWRATKARWWCGYGESTALRHGESRQIELAPGNIYSDAWQEKRREEPESRTETRPSGL